MDQQPGSSGTIGSEKEEGHRVLVTRLAPYTKKKDLLKLLKDFKPVHVVVLRKPTGNHAMITFEKKEQAEAVVKGKFTCHKRQLLITPADPWHTRIVPGSKPIAPILKTFSPEETGGALPIECIAAIAQFLPYVDRARMEMVCRRWRAGVLASFKTSTIIDMNDHRWPESWNGRVVTTEGLYWLLQRSAIFITSIKFADKLLSSLLKPQVFAISVKACENLENVDFSAVTIRPSAIRELLRVSERLKILNFGPTEVTVDIEIAELLKRSQILETLANCNTKITGKGLMAPPITLKRLTLSYCNDLQARYLAVLIEKTKSLEYLALRFKNSLRDDSLFDKLKENINLQNTLTELEIASIRVIPEEEEMQIDEIEMPDQLPFAELELGPVQPGLQMLAIYKALTSLKLLFCGWVTNHTIEEIASNLKLLESLDLSGCTNVRGAGQIESLSELAYLKSLELNNMHPQFTGQGLLQLRGLKSLHCRANQGIREETICSVVRNCTQLELLDIEACEQLGKAVLTCAYQVVRTTNRLVPLKVHVAGTKVTRSTKLKRNFFLIVDYNRYYRPLFQ